MLLKITNNNLNKVLTDKMKDIWVNDKQAPKNTLLKASGNR